MAQTYTINGVAYSFPDVDDSDWGQNVTDWAGAVSSFLLQRTGGTFTLSAEVDFGSSYGLLVKDLGSKTANPASAGFIQLATTDVIAWRNNANSGDINLSKGTDDKLEFNSIDLVDVSSAQTLTNKTISGATLTGLTSIVFEGATSNDYETTLTVTDPTDDRTWTIPDSTDTFVGKATTDTLTNKTLTSPVITSPTVNTGLNLGQGAAVVFEGASDNAHETTLTVTDPTGDRTVTIPDATTTLIGDNTTDTLTNKTLTTPTMSSPTISATSGSVGGKIVFKEGSSGGTDAVTLQSPATLGGDKTVTLPGATTTLVGTDTTDTLQNKTLTNPSVSASGSLSILEGSTIIFEGTTANDFETTLTVTDPTADRTITLPDATDTLVGKDTTDTLTNKTLTSPTVGTALNMAEDATIIFEGATSNAHETTLTVTDPTGDRVVSLPDATDTLVGKATTDTLTNKTLTGANIGTGKVTDYLAFDSVSDPGATPDSNDVFLYAKENKLYYKDSNDVVAEVGSGGGAGDADTIQLKAANDFSAVNVAPWYTGSNPVPGGGGTIGGTWELSTSNPLINTNDATKVFHYSNGTSNRKNDYFEIELDVPNYAKGHNLVVQLFYRTVGAEDTDFLFFARDRTADYETTTSSSGALNTITLASATGFAVGDRICIQDDSDARHFRYVTAVSGSNITFSGSAITVGSGDVVVSKYFTDELDYITAENNTTNYEGKIRKWAFQINDTTTKIRVGFIYDNTATSTNELFFDQILLSSNQFLQTSSRGQAESYKPTSFSSFWKTAGGSGPHYTFNTTNIAPSGSSPTLANSKLVQIADITGPGSVGTVTAIKAKQKIQLDIAVTCNSQANAGVNIVDSSGVNIAANYFTASYWGNTNASIVINKDDYVYLKHDANNSAEGGITFTATPEVSDCILLNSQDEIFSDWNDNGKFTDSVKAYGSGSGGTDPTFADAGLDVNTYKWRRDGSDMLIYIAFRNNTTTGMARGTGGDYAIDLPSGYTADAGFYKFGPTTDYTGGSTGGIPVQYNTLGKGSFTDGTGGTTSGEAYSYLVTDSKFKIGVIGQYGATQNWYGNWGSTHFHLEASTVQWVLQARVKIAGWTSTFNPVLSMPLVDLGEPVETWFRSMTSDSNFWDGTGVQRQWNEALLVGPNTSSTVAGNIANSNLISIEDKTSGSNTVTAIVAKQDIVLTAIISSYINSTGNIYWLNQNDQTLSTEQTHNSDNYIESCPVEVYLRAGEYIWAQTDAYANDGGITITAKKVQSGNMAHIIKPAVVTISHENSSYGTWGDADNNIGGTNAWHTRKLNTIKGESWFVESFASNVFTLGAGTYKVIGHAPIYAGNQHKSRLYNTTDSEVVVVGNNSYANASYNGQTSSLIMGSFTITKSTSFRIETIINNDNGGISQGGIDGGGDQSGPAVFTTIMVEKLK